MILFFPSPPSPAPPMVRIFSVFFCSFFVVFCVAYFYTTSFNIFKYIYIFLSYLKKQKQDNFQREKANQCRGHFLFLAMVPKV